MGALLERIRTAMKLRRGRCATCGKVLRDDATGRFCSDFCDEQAWLDSAM